MGPPLGYPEAVTAASPLRRAPLLAAGLWSALFALAGCPPRETVIEVSPSGAATLINACGRPPLDVSTLCDEVDETCRDAGPQLADACASAQQQCRSLEQEQQEATCRVDALSTRPPDIASSSGRMGTRVALVAVEGDKPVIRAQSGCGQIVFDCERDILDEVCAAAGLNQGIQNAFPEEGLGFAGLEAAEDVIPVVLVYFDYDRDGMTACTTDELFACGALGLRLPGADTYDMVCASCQQGAAATVESAPCLSSCFLNICAELSAALDAQ